ncbi:MAG: hypothetical protein ABL878_20635, partial [Burkholderiales bacterium]
MALMASEAPTIDIPAHIPTELVRDFDFDAFCRELDDPFLAAARMLDGPPIVLGTRVFFGKPAWILARHALIEEAFLHPEMFSNRRPARSSEKQEGSALR